MRLRITVLTAVATGLCLSIGLSLAGCGQPAGVQAGGHQLGSTVEDPAVHWVDGYCAAVAQLVRTLSTMPEVDPSGPQQASRTSSALLGSVLGGFDRTLAGLGGLGPAPVSGGDQVRREAIATFGGIRGRVAEAKERIDSAAASADIEATRHALGGAGAPLDEIAKVDLFQGLNAVPDLADASRRAANCEPLTAKNPAPHLRLTG